ncbi:hypothetical protein GTP44_19645 [Duganella sp. FT50W]|uniref:DUF2357 domain-containing protein n=1 Tax=Duganella lactea TaxID=2692173 RepID=A0A6L8MQK5_9BURK|nr:hypothetical protein [Duganella lactea]MYM84155.1 hypothetical protein [Duganella lactea]
MNDAILVSISGEDFIYDENSPQTFVIKETDYLSISVRAEAVQLSAPIIRFEDYETPFELVMQSGGAQVYQTAVRTYLSECFGKVVARLYLDENVIPIVFDVLAKKTSAEQALKMIRYLAEVSPLLVKACLARSSTPFGNLPGEEIEPETLLTVAEGIISVLQSTRQELIANIRERLVPKRLPLRSTNKLTCEVDPVEVLSNLDALTPATGIGDVSLRGRNFDLGDIEVSAVQPTADVGENHILLGGLFSMRRGLLALVNQLSDFSSSTVNTPAGYESFTRLLLSVTAEGMLIRCHASLEAIEGFIDLFERKLGVTYMGELVPVMTPFVRSTRVYRALFTQLADWYSLGAPAIGKLQFMLKMKSLSKIYELFTFYHIFEEFSSTGWLVIDSTAHPEYGDFMTKTVVFSKNSEKITVQYEPIVEKLNTNTRHGDLIDVAHRHSAEHPYWTPDFVLKWETAEQHRYVILDAKYSTANSVRQYAIPAIYSKYYEGTAVFDARNGFASSANIVAVVAVYALEWNNPNYISKWESQGIFSNVPRIPAIGGMGLMTDNDALFRRCLNRILDLTRILAQPSLEGQVQSSTLV